MLTGQYVNGYFTLNSITLAHTNNRISNRQLSLNNNIGNPDTSPY